MHIDCLRVAVSAAARLCACLLDIKVLLLAKSDGISVDHEKFLVSDSGKCRMTFLGFFFFFSFWEFPMGL